MVDFVGLLKRTIDAQSSATPVLRRRIYDRTRETVERQLSSKPMPPEVAALQRRMLEKAIEQVENSYLDGGGRDSVSPQAVDAGSGHPQAASARGRDVFNELRKNAGMNPPARQTAQRRTAASGGYMAEINPYGAAGGDDEPALPSPAAYARGGARGSRAGASIGAYGEEASAAGGRGSSAASRGGAYPARSSTPAMAESAYGGAGAQSGSYGGAGGAAAANLSSYGGEMPIRGIFPLDDEEEDAGFSPYGGEPSRPAQSGGRRSLRPYGDDDEPAQARGAYPRRDADAPLPDYESGYPQGGAEPQFSGQYGELSADGQTAEPRFLNSYGDEDASAAHDEPYAGGGFSGGDYNGGYGQLSAGAQSQEPQAEIKPSPYNIAGSDFSADYQHEPQFSDNAYPDGSEAEHPSDEAAERPADETEADLPPLHDFLFGSAHRDNASESDAQSDHNSYGAGEFSAPAAEAESAPKPQAAEPHIAALDLTGFSAPGIEPFLEPGTEDRESLAAADDYSPLPDFLLEDPDEKSGGSKSAADSGMTEDEQIAFNLQQALVGHEDSEIARRLAQKKAAQEKEQAKPAESGSESLMPLPDDFLLADDASANPAGGSGLLPEMGGKDKEKSGDKPADAGSLSVAPDSAAASIFAQSAIREKQRSGKKRMITGGAIILVLLVILSGIVWFLKDYTKSSIHKPAPAAAAAAPEQKTNAEKVSQRLTEDGQEVSAAPPKQAAQPAADNSASVAQAIKQATLTAKGDVLFRESKTALMPSTQANGSVTWSIIHEKTDAGTDTVLRASLTVPERDMVMRMTIRPNHDKTIPAVYLAELMFIVPENFEGQAVDKISPIMFKQTQDSTPQELMDAHIYKINDNFFVMTMNSPVPGNSINPKLQRNIALMEQLPWLTLNAAYKNGRIAEFNFSKGDNGDAVFKQFFDAQSAALQGLPAQANTNYAPGLSTQPGK